MLPANQTAAFTLSSSALYRITIARDLGAVDCERLGELQIEAHRSWGEQGGPVTSLVGRMADQAQLIGLLENLHGLRLPILSVEMLRREP